MSQGSIFYRRYAICMASFILVTLIFAPFVVQQSHADDQTISKKASTEKETEKETAKKKDAAPKKGTLKVRSKKIAPRSTRPIVTLSVIETRSPSTEEKKSIEDRATHHEVATITVPQGDQKLPIHTFCIDSKGQLLATCGGERLEYKRLKNSRDFEIEEIEEPSSIKVLSPEGELLATWDIEVTPQSINVAPDGTIFAAGSGKLIKLSPEGKILKVAQTPNYDQLPPIPEVPEKEPAVDVSKMTDEQREKHEAELEVREERIKKLRKKHREFREQLGELFRKGKAAEKGNDEEEKNQVAAEREKIQGVYRKNSKELRELTTNERMIAMRKRVVAIRQRSIPGIAATKEDLFVVCATAKGYGYEVWRTDHNFENPTKIAEKLRGCCRQLDIQARDGKVWVAENSRKRVICYDRDGKELAKWGKDERKYGEEGFGSCCNPMNLRLSVDGNVYTSESGPGTIKKFDPEGKFLGYIAKAKIVPGCKHVALDMNKEGTRFYMLDITRSRIIVFEDKTRVTTHEQTATISIPQGEDKLPIHSFCVDHKGRLLATCGGPRVSVRRKKQEDGSLKIDLTEADDPASIKVLDADGKLLDSWKLGFQPRSINVGSDGSIYVAGQGHIAKLDENGKILKTAEAPNIAELDPLPEVPEAKDEDAALTDEEKEAKKQKMANFNEKRIKLRQQIRGFRDKRNKATDEDEKVKLAGEYKELTTEYLQIGREIRNMTETARTVAIRAYYGAMRRRTIPGIAVSDKDIFVVGMPTKGYGYNVWRMNLDFQEPKLIVEKLRGCCSQLDIQTKNGNLWVAENSRMRVTCYDRDGKQLVQFGTHDRKDPTSGYGFGSCCNPMNLRLNAAGDVYTAEASVGRLKRFSSEGKFIETVAKLKIVPGCKHVAIGVTDNGDRLYMLDITRAQIAVIDRKKK